MTESMHKQQESRNKNRRERNWHGQILRCRAGLWMGVAGGVGCAMLFWGGLNFMDLRAEVSGSAAVENVIGQNMVDAPSRTDALEIIYIPGWLKHGAHEDIRAILETMYPGAAVRLFLWDNVHAWREAREQADLSSVTLAEQLAGLSPERREHTILVGHSLGGRLTVRTLARLSERHMSVRQAILLAAAIPDDDPDLGRAFRGTLGPILNVCNPDDVTLKYCYGALGEGTRPALGANGRLHSHPQCFDLVVPDEITERTALSEQFPVMNLGLVKRLANHHAKFYLSYLQEQMDNDFVAAPLVIVPQDKVNLELPVADKRIFWTEVDTFENWSLQRHKLSGIYRILDDTRHRRAWGAKSRMEAAFATVREQLNCARRQAEHNTSNETGSL